MEYRKLMEKWEIKLNNPVLDPAFVQKATEFETKVKNNELSDEEIKTWDDELVKSFNELHTFTEEENIEVKEAKHGKEVAEAKNEIADAETLETLISLQTKFAHLPELTDFIQKRIDKVQKATTDNQQEQFTAEAQAEIKAWEYASLSDLLEKYKDYPELISLIEARIEAEKPAPKAETLRDKLSGAKKREFTYEDLKAFGINPTGSDMEIEGVYLQKIYLYRIYKIISVDGNKI